MKIKLQIILCLLLVTELTSAQVLWYGDPDRNYLQSFYRLSRESGETGTVSTAIDPEHGKVWVLNKPSGEKRCEFARTEGTVNSYTPKEGDLLYVGWRVKMNIAGNSFPSGFAMFQWKSDNTHSQNYPFLIGGDGKSISLSAYDAGTGSQASRKEELCSKNVPENNWVSIVIGVKVSRNENIGYLECWFDGVKQNMPGGGTRFKHRTLDDNGNYCKWGAYNEASRNFNITAYLDEMRISRNFDDVMNPLKGGSTNTTNKDPNVSITSPLNNATFTLGQTINLAATASDSDGNIDRINFKIDGGYYSNDKTMPYTGTFTPSEAGTYLVSAKAFDNDGGEKEVSVTVNVTDQNKKPTASFAEPTFSSIKEGYTELYVLVNASDPDGDAISTLLFIDGKEIRPENGSPYEWGKPGTSTSFETLNLKPGIHSFEVVVTDAKGASISIEKLITVIENKAPFKGTPIVISGTLEMENYDKGGQGVGYSDTDDDNNGETYRSDGVDIAGDPTSGYNVGWTADGEWLEYTVDVKTAGDYDLKFFTSSLNGGGVVNLTLGGEIILSNISIPKTGDWNTYTSFTEQATLTKGQQLLRFNIVKAGFNIDKIEFSPSTITSIENSLVNELTIYPNPSSSGVFKLNREVRWEVYSALGSLLQRGNGTIINLEAEPMGVYFIKTDNVAKRVIIE